LSWRASFPVKAATQEGIEAVGFANYAGMPFQKIYG
jgi:hypothetical protein